MNCDFSVCFFLITLLPIRSSHNLFSEIQLKLLNEALKCLQPVPKRAVLSLACTHGLAWVTWKQLCSCVNSSQWPYRTWSIKVMNQSVTIMWIGAGLVKNQKWGWVGPGVISLINISLHIFSMSCIYAKWSTVVLLLMYGPVRMKYVFKP